MAFMAYLIYVTARTIPKIWNPYDILGISDVWNSILAELRGYADIDVVCHRKADQVALQAPLPQIPPRQDQTRSS
jgi:hypothetical protein